MSDPYFIGGIVFIFLCVTIGLAWFFLRKTKTETDTVVDTGGGVEFAAETAVVPPQGAGAGSGSGTGTGSGTGAGTGSGVGTGSGSGSGSGTGTIQTVRGYPTSGQWLEKVFDTITETPRVNYTLESCIAEATKRDAIAFTYREPTSAPTYANTCVGWAFIPGNTTNVKDPLTNVTGCIDPAKSWSKGEGCGQQKATSNAPNLWPVGGATAGAGEQCTPIRGIPNGSVYQFDATGKKCFLQLCALGYDMLDGICVPIQNIVLNSNEVRGYDSRLFDASYRTPIGSSWYSPETCARMAELNSNTAWSYINSQHTNSSLKNSCRFYNFTTNPSGTGGLVEVNTAISKCTNPSKVFPNCAPTSYSACVPAFKTAVKNTLLTRNNIDTLKTYGPYYPKAPPGGWTDATRTIHYTALDSTNPERILIFKTPVVRDTDCGFEAYFEQTYNETQNPGSPGWLIIKNTRLNTTQKSPSIYEFQASNLASTATWLTNLDLS